MLRFRYPPDGSGDDPAVGNRCAGHHAAKGAEGQTLTVVDPFAGDLIQLRLPDPFGNKECLIWMSVDPA
jgi:hypothetical protein